MTTLNHAIDLNPDTIAHADPADKASRTLQPREVGLPVVDAISGAITILRAQVLASDSYHDAVPILSDANLLTLLQGISDWSGVTLTNAVGPWWKLGASTPNDAYGSVIGDSAQATVIGLDDETLISGGHCRLDWTTGVAYDAGDDPALDFLSRYLYGTWLANGPFWAGDLTDATSATTPCSLYSSGGFAAAGKVWAGGALVTDTGLYLTDPATATNYWTPAAIAAAVAGAITLNAGSDLNLVCAGNFTLNAQTYVPLTVNVDINGTVTAAEIIGRLL